MIFLLAGLVLVVFAVIKGQFGFALVGLATGFYGTAQELLQKPELAQYAELLRVGKDVCLLVMAITVILLAVWRARKNG